MLSKKQLGKLGEDLVERHLKKRGYKILERNFQCKQGEIDIVAQEKDTLVFVEVKTRTSEDFGPPELAVTPWKIRKIKKTGHFYKLVHPELPEALRIDVVAVEFDVYQKTSRVEIIKNAPC